MRVNNPAQVLQAVLLAFFVASCHSQQCTHTLLPDDAPPSVRALSAVALDGPTDLETCQVGDFSIDVVGSNGNQGIVVRRGEHSLFIGDRAQSTVLADDAPVATISTSVSEAGASGLIYKGHDPRTAATFLVVDADLDGQPDLRRRINTDATTQTEVWYQGKWQVLVDREGQPGLVVDRRFIALPELLETMGLRGKVNLPW